MCDNLQSIKKTKSYIILKTAHQPPVQAAPATDTTIIVNQHATTTGSVQLHAKAFGSADC
jgi:hypothetical protein